MNQEAPTSTSGGMFTEGNSDENPWEEISREEYEDRKNSIIKRKKMNMSAN